MPISRTARVRRLSLLTAAVWLTACGDSGTGGRDAGTPPVAATTSPAAASPAPSPAAIAAADSSACTNEADFNAGTQLTYDLQQTSPGRPTGTTHHGVTTGKRQSFGGATPVAFEQTFYDAGKKPFATATILRDLVDGKMVRYGETHGGGGTRATSTHTPVPAIPVSMQPGQTVTLAYRVETVSPGAKVAMDVTEALTYQGREKLSTALGTFDTCRFVLASTTTVGKSPDITVDVTSWIAAEGPFRGQRLKAFVPATGGRPESTDVVTQMSYAPK